MPFASQPFMQYMARPHWSTREPKPVQELHPNALSNQEHIDDLGLNWDSFKWRNHQPDIGRFFNVDPLSEKYYYNSSYAFSENRVVDGVELEGLEWSSIKDEESKTIVNTVTVKVKNSSSIPNSEAIALAMDIENNAEEVLSGTDSDGYKQVVLVTLDFESEVEEGDFYIDFVDNVTLANGDQSSTASGRVDEIANTQSNRIQAKSSQDLERDRHLMVKSGVHEIGHTGGLTHPEPTPSQAGVDASGNYLEDGNLMQQMNGGGTNVTPGQRTVIKNEIDQDTN